MEFKLVLYIYVSLAYDIPLFYGKTIYTGYYFFVTPVITSAR